MPCIEYKGKKYTYEEFGAMLRNGAFAKMAKSGELNVESLGAEVPSSLLEGARKQIAPQTSSNFANLTTDEDGNYVFFHRGAKGFDEIRPGTGQSGITPSNEAAAIGRVGGVAMYYTKPTDSETMVSGQAQYAVTIAPDEVYDFNEDPENYIVEARQRFEQEHPGKAFDANNQLAYITKIAGENGYKMVVAEWTNGRTRAQTTEALKPTDTQLFEGDVVTKTFDKEYTTNEQKGWSPVVPETKQKKLDALYNKIYRERNKQNRYDDLYHLEADATKKTQDEITELINNSDISQELKDEYNQILGEKEQTRRSERKSAQDLVTEVERIKSVDKADEDGATFNLDGTKYEGVGLVVPAASINTTVEELTPEMITDFVDQQRSKIGDDAVVKVGIYKFKDSNKVSIDLNIIAPESSRDVAIEFARLAGQESLFDLRTFENIKTGADGKNPINFSDQQFKDIAKALKEGKMPNVFGAQETTALDDIFDNTEIQSEVDNALKAMSEIMPELNIVVHDTYESYLDALGESEEAESGGFFDGENTIHINKRAASDTTVAHEVFHAVLKKMLGSERAIQKKALSMVRNLSGQIKSDPQLKAALDEFVGRYTENPETMNEEAVSELFGMLNAGYADLKPVERSAIRKFIDAIAKLLGLGDFIRVKENDYVDLLNTLSQKIRTGEAITTEDVVSLSEQGGKPVVGTFTKKKSLGVKAPSVKDDTRAYVRELIKEINLSQLEGKKFLTNMYDFTSAGEIDLGNGIIIIGFGGKNYVPYIMSLKGKKLNDISNIAAFNSEQNAKDFIRAAQEGNVSLFAPHSGGLESSWQFQQHIFAELIDAILDNDIMSSKELIDRFNTFSTSKEGTKAFRTFSKRYAKEFGNEIKDLSVFEKNPRELVRLLDIDNNFSPDLRKFLQSKIITTKKFKEYLGYNNSIQFAERLMDPLNKGVKGGEIMSVIEFDPSTLKIKKTKIGDIDHHPSFGWTVVGKIKNIYQPTEFHQSKDITDSYTFYNSEGVRVSKPSDYLATEYVKEYELAKKGLVKDKKTGKTKKRTGGVFEGTLEDYAEFLFNQSNVSSSSGSIVKVAQFRPSRRKQIVKQRTDQASDKLKKLFERDNIPLSIQEAKEIVGEVIDWADWYDGLSSYVTDIFQEYSEDILSMLPLSSMAANSSATVGLSINNAEKIYKGEKPSGVAEYYGYVTDFLEGKGIKSDKMSEFFKALTGNKDAIAVDMHVWSLIMGKDPNKKQVNPSNKAEFEKAKEFVRVLSDELGLAPREVQAALWAANILRTGGRPDSYEEYFKKQLDEKGLSQRIENWRNQGYKPFSEVRKEKERAETSKVKKQIKVLTSDIGIDRSSIPMDKASDSVPIGDITASNGNKLKLSAKEINLSYPGKKKFVRRIEAVDKDGKKAIISFWRDKSDVLEKDNMIILYVEGTDGYGTDLIKSLISESESEGVKKIIADDVESLNASKYWEDKLGFSKDSDDRSIRVLDLTKTPKTVKKQTPAISKKIEAALNSGATEQEIIDKMTQVGYTEAEAKAYIEQYNNMRSDEYARVKANIDTITKKVADRSGKNANPKVVRQRQYDDAMNYLQNSLWYENASDTEREASVREIRSDLGFREKAAPAAAKVTEGKRDTITIDSLQALAQSIRDQNRGAKAALKDLAEKRESLRVALNTLVNKAKITARQATTILNKFSKVNLNDDQAVKDLIDYVEQTYKDAEITNQVRQAAQTAKDERRGAKAALKDLAEKREALRVALKSLVTSGKITNRQASVMLNKVMSVNLNNDKAVDKLIKYIEKVYNNAEIAEKMSKANGMRRTAKKNIKSKIGSAKVAFPLLDKLFSIDSRQIPLEVLDTYVGIVNQFGKRVGVLSTEKMADVIQKAQDVISAINEEASKANDLAMIFEMYPDKVLDANGDVLFDKTVKKMKDDGYIDEATAKEMDEYRSDIYKKERATKEEDAQERKDLIKEIVAAKLVTSSRLSDANERKAAREIIQMARNKKMLKALSTQSLRNLAAIMKNIDAGFFPNYGVKLMQAMQIEQQLPDVKNTLENVSLRVISNAYNKLKSLVFRGQTSIELTLESNLATELDFMLGDNKNRHVYNSVIKPLAKAYATFDSEVTSIREKMSEAVEMLERQFSGNTNKVAASKFKIMAYMLQKEFETNAGQKGVAPAVDFINQTIKAIKGRDTMYTENDIAILEDIKDNYMTDGQIDMNKIMDSLSAREKKALGILEAINASMHDKAIFTSGVIRGNRTNMYNNYVPHSVISRKMDNDEKMASVVNAYNNVQAVGTKAGSLQERTSGAKPIMFDPFLASMNSATDVLLDFHMTIPMQTTSKLLQRTKDELLNDDASDKSIDAVNAVQAIRDRVARFVFTNNKYHDDSILATLGRSYLNTMYRNTLGSVPRFLNELQSNSWYVLTNPANWASGVKYVYKDSDAIGGVQGREIMSLLGSTVVGKLYGKGATGKFADVGLLGSDDVAQGSSSKGSLEVTKDVIARYSIKPLAKFTDYVGDTLVSTPDRLMSIPVWYGSFANEFKRRTGEDIEFSKITDERYRNKYKAALDAATDYADNEVVQAASTVNPFQKAAKLNVDKSKPTYRRFIATVNNYLTNFMITEFNTARAAAYSLVTEGRIPKPKAAAMLTGVYLRVVTYTLMANIITGGFYSLLGFDKDDEEEEELTWDDVVRAAAGGFISMLVSRNFGNIFKIVENYGIEQLNEEYGDMLRQGEEYDPYKHSLVFNKIKEKEITKDPLKTLSVNFAGPYGETVKGVWKINDLIEYENRASGKNKFSEMKKRISLSGRRKADRMEDMKNDVIFRVGAGSGLIPFAKDIKPIMSGRYKKKGED